TTTGIASVLSVAAGGVAVSGNVLLVINNSVNYVAIYQKGVNATGDITMDAGMHSSAKSELAAATAGGIAVGITTSIDVLNSDTRAFIDTTGVTVNGANIVVRAGRPDDPKVDGEELNTSEATAIAVSANIGGALAASLNVAIADNHTKNYAQVLGTGTINATGGLHALAYGTAKADATLYGVSATLGLNIAGSVAVSVLQSLQEASVISENVNALSLEVISELNNKSGVRDADVSHASITTGSGSFGGGSITVNIAVAYGKGSSIASASATKSMSVGRSGAYGDITVKSLGGANTKADSANVSEGSSFAAALIMVFAYNDATFSSKLELPTGATAYAKAVTVSTDYVANATTDLTPSLGGVSLSGIKAEANLTAAVSFANAQASIAGAGTLNAHGNVNVLATGTAKATSTVSGVTVDISFAKIAVNLSFAEVTATQIASIDKTVINTNGGKASVTSTFNDADTTGAVATVGGNGTSKAVKVNVIGGTASIAAADMGATVKATTSGVSLDTSDGKGGFGTVDVKVKARSYASADINVPSVGISLLNATLLFTYATAGGTFAAELGIGNAKESNVGTTSVDDTYSSIATSATGPAGGVGVSLADVKVNVSIATASSNATAALTGVGVLNVNGNLSVTANGSGSAAAEGRTHKVTVTLANVAVNEVQAYMSVVQKAYVEMDATAASDVHVTGSLK
ncbi:MAG: beta strand repeat-containing protein, partial [Olsenella sp.]